MQDALVLERGAGDLEERMRRLSSSFGSLLKDAGRNSEVLEVLLGEDVLEFLRRPPAYQEALSIPGLKEHIRSLNHSLTALHSKRVPTVTKHHSGRSRGSGDASPTSCYLLLGDRAHLLLSVARRQAPPPVMLLGDRAHLLSSAARRQGPPTVICC